MTAGVLRLGLGVVTAMTCASVVPTVARSAEDAAALAGAKTLKCVIDLGTYADWKSVNAKGEPNLVQDRQGKTGTFVLDAIDTLKGKARLIGDSEIGEGASDIQVIQTPIGFTFIQVNPGIVDVITVFTSHPKPSSKDFIAVESRHLSIPILGGRLPGPSQSHGTCRILE